MGKTTLARIVFHMVSNRFEACCFLDNVRKVSEKDGSISIQDVDFGVLMLKNKL